MKKYIILIPAIVALLSCKKLTQVAEPVDTITTPASFSSNANANAAVIGIYNSLLLGYYSGNLNGVGFANVLTTIDAGLSADELQNFGNQNGDLPFQSNTLNSSTNLSDVFYLWAGPYYSIYIANAAINQLPHSTGVDSTIRNQLGAEAKFLRAFCYFYLVNFFGESYKNNPNGVGVPLLTTTEYATNRIEARSTVAKIYDQMIQDLTDAKSNLPVDYSASGGQRIRVNKGGATALLSRVYLYKKDYQNAYSSANSIINNNLYNLELNLNDVFLPNSKETILQWQTSTQRFPWATYEGNRLLPFHNASNPNYYLSESLINAFEPGDKRWQEWVDTTNYEGLNYFYPYKYKVKFGRPPGNVTEYYMVLRLAEQYLIRAEAQANGAGNGISGAISDLNTIRVRAGLSPLMPDLTKDQVLAAIAQERRIEMFCEWGHRWFDLKRTGVAQTVLSANKNISIPAYQLIYPIPESETIKNNNLVQNEGY